MFSRAERQIFKDTEYTELKIGDLRRDRDVIGNDAAKCVK